ncbi:MAG: serine/threonine-protein kinase [Polyangiales bacterium]
MSVERPHTPPASAGRGRADETQVATEARLPTGDAPAQGPLSPGAVLGHYKVLRHIGTGGMGHIHAAEDLHLQREVALKVSTRADGRTLDEARALAALNHPNVVTIYELGSHEGSAYIVMELLRGSTLREVLAARRPTPEEVRAWATDALAGIEAAHAVGVLHLDLKPDNLFVTQTGALKLLDFGVARRWRPGDDPGEGTMAGTVPYMAPEMILGRPVDARADLFSFGVILHELATGLHPFRGRDRVAALQRGEAVAPPEGVRFDDPAVAALTRACLASEPERRPQGAAEALAMLRGARPEALDAPAPRTAAELAAVAPLTHRTFSVRVDATGRVVMEGTITPRDPEQTLVPHFHRVHACAAGGGDLVLDVRGVKQINSSALGMFIRWVAWIAAEPPARRYRLVVLADAAVLWQRANLKPLEMIAPDAIRVRYGDTP